MATRVFNATIGSRLVIKLTPSSVSGKEVQLTVTDPVSSDPAVATLEAHPTNPRLFYANIVGPGECDLTLPCACEVAAPPPPVTEPPTEPLPPTTLATTETLHLVVVDPAIEVPEAITVETDVTGASEVITEPETPPAY
jgi:hypothetical protein